MPDFSLNLNGIIAIIAIITTITVAYFANWWRNRKKLSYEIIAESLLLTADEEIKDDLQILYKGAEVKNVHLLILKIINNGNQPILSNDFEKPLNLVFSEDAEILSAKPVSVRPENLDVSITFEKNILALTPLLMNSEDFALIKLIISSNSSQFKVDTRIVGVKEVKKAYTKFNSKPLWLMTLFCFVLSLSSFFVIDNKYYPYNAILALTFLGLCAFFMYLDYRLEPN
jgi:hypothetical protein